MSDRPCNYCEFKRIKAKAKKAGNIVSVLSDATWGMGGVNVYSHQPNVDIMKLPGGEKGKRKKYWVAWYMELTKECCC